MSEPRSRSGSRSLSRHQANGNANGDSRAVQKGKGYTVWLGGLPENIQEDAIRDKFGTYGEIYDVRLKHMGKGPPFCFVEFATHAAADQSVRECNQQECFGSTQVKVQHASTGDRRNNDRNDRRRSRSNRRGYGGRRDSRGRGGGQPRRDSRGRGRGRRDSRGGGRGGNNGGRRDSRGGKGGNYTRTQVPSGKFKITLENLPRDMTWTELKELGRNYDSQNGGRNVTFARTYRGNNGIACGILEFRERRDAENVMDKLDGRKIHGHDQELRVSFGDNR